MELNISTHVAVPKKLDSRKRWYSSLAFERTSATRTNPRANANTERTATTRTKRWMFVVRPGSFELLTHSGFYLFSQRAEHPQSLQSRVRSPSSL